jgi:RNA polymerase primary sigma factor
MAAANRYPLLTAAEELHLSTLVRTWLDSPEPTKQQIRAGQRAKQRMINCNLRLAAKVTFSFRKQISARHGDVEDALQESVMGLSRAVEKFDPQRGYKFSTYGTLWLGQAIRRWLQVGCDAIRRPTGAQDLIRRWRYRPEDGNGPQSMAAFCEQWGYTQEKVINELHQHHVTSVFSLDHHCGNDDGSDLIDLIADPSQDVDDDAADRALAIEALEAVAAPQLRLVELSLATPQKQIAAVVGCRPHQVRARVDAAKAELREHLSRPVELLPRQNVVQINDYRPPVTTSNGLAALEKLVEAPVAEPAAPAKKRRTRRTAAQIAADKAAKAPELITMEIGGVTVKASATDCVALLRGLQAA